MLALGSQNAAVSFYFFSGIAAAGAVILIFRVFGGLVYLFVEACKKSLPQVHQQEILNRRPTRAIVPGLYETQPQGIENVSPKATNDKGFESNPELIGKKNGADRSGSINTLLEEESKIPFPEVKTEKEGLKSSRRSKLSPIENDVKRRNKRKRSGKRVNTEKFAAIPLEERDDYLEFKKIKELRLLKNCTEKVNDLMLPQYNAPIDSGPINFSIKKKFVSDIDGIAEKIDKENEEINNSFQNDGSHNIS